MSGRGVLKSCVEELEGTKGGLRERRERDRREEGASRVRSEAGGTEMRGGRERGRDRR